MTPDQRSALIAIDASVVAITEAVRVLLNTYVGGTSPSTRPHMHYYAGLAYGTEYIGPMKGLG